jgi:hypothetical protein
MKTIHVIILLAASAGAVYLYRRHKAGAIVLPQPAGGMIPLPATEIKKIVDLPGGLIEQTSGNTGIVPPLLQDTRPTSPSLPAVSPPAPVQSVPSIVKKVTTYGATKRATLAI